MKASLLQLGRSFPMKINGLSTSLMIKTTAVLHVFPLHLERRLRR